MSDTLDKLNKLIQTIKSDSIKNFLESLRKGYEDYGRLTEKQEQALEKFWNNRDRTKLKKMGLE